MTEPNDSDDVYAAGYGGSEQLDTSETLTGDNTQDPLDAGYSPPDREPKATRFGTTADEQRTGETLDQLLGEEEPDIGIEDSFDEPDARAGRLVAPGGDEFGDLESDAVAHDVGRDGEAASAEEAAIHIVEGEDE